MANKQVFTFFSSSGNTGTTNTVFSVAQSLSKQIDARIGVLSLNGWDDSSDYFIDPPAYLNTLKPRLAGRMLGDDTELLGRFKEIEQNKLYILAGNQNRRLERIFTTEEIEYLIERSQQIFDVVLIDAGCHLDNAMSVQAVYSAGTHFAVLTQQPKVLKRFNQIHDDILQPLFLNKEEMMFIVNQYQEKTFLLTDKQIAKELDVPEVFSIPLAESGMISELENRILYSYNQPKYQLTIDKIAKFIGEEAGARFKEVPPVRKGLARIFS